MTNGFRMIFVNFISMRQVPGRSNDLCKEIFLQLLVWLLNNTENESFPRVCIRNQDALCLSKMQEKAVGHQGYGQGLGIIVRELKL